MCIYLNDDSNQIKKRDQPQFDHNLTHQKNMYEMKCEQKFGMGSTYDYNKEIQITIIQSVPAWVKTKCAIRKIIRTVSSIIKINPLEGCLLSWLLSKSKYQIEKISIQSRTNIVEEQFDHKVLIFTLLNAYYVKSFVCEKVDIQIDDEILTHITNFKALYQKFNPEKSLKTLSLSDINTLFHEWTCRRQKKNKTDYNSLVDRILYLSKTYNVGIPEEPKEQKLGAPRKRRKNNQSEQIKSDLHSWAQKQKSISIRDKRNSIKFSNSVQNGDFIPLSQQNPFKREQAADMGLLRRSTRNMLQSINIYDMIPSQDNLFNSQISNNNNIFNSSLQNSIVDSSSRAKKQEHGNSLGNSMRLKYTSSFDCLK